MTHNQILMAKIIDEQKIDGNVCHVLVLKSLLNNLNITCEILKKGKKTKYFKHFMSTFSKKYIISNTFPYIIYY
jgi:hypothetical protein